MADDGIKTVVAKLNLDASSWADTIKDVRGQIGSIAEMSKITAAADAAASASAVSATKEQISAQKDVTAAKEASSKAAIAGTAAEKAAQEELNAVVLENLRKQGELLDAQNEKIRASIELMRERAKESSKGEESGVSLSGVAGAVGAGALGSGILGSTLGGLLKGAGLTLGIEAAYEGLTKLTEKVKEFIEDSGGLQKVTETFQQLAPAHGADPTEFLEKLRASTHNLVNDVDLLRTANTFMQSGLGMSTEDMVKLTEATVGLARAQGNDAQTAVQQLNRAFLTGRANQLGYATGVQKTLLTITGLGSALSETQKSQLNFAQTAKIIEQRYENLGQPLLTYTDRLKQIQVVQSQLFEGAAQGVVKSQGFTSFMKTLGGMIDSLGGLEKIATAVGNALGNMFSVVGAAFTAFGSTAKTAIEPVTVLIESLADALGYVKDNWTLAAGSGDTFTDMMQRMHPILLSNIKFIAELSRQVKLFVADFTAGGDAFMLPSRTADIMTQKNNADKSGRYSGMTGQAKLFADSFGQAKDELNNRYNASSSAADADYNKLVSGQSDQYMRGMKDKNPNYKGKNIPPPGDPGEAMREAVAVAKATEEAKIAAAKEALARIKELLGDEADANEEMYKKGNESIKDYYANKDAYALQSYTATVQELNAEAEARKADLKVQLDQHKIFKPAYDQQVKKVDDDTRTGISNASRVRNKALSQDTIGLASDASQAQIKIINSVLEAQKTALADQVDSTKSAFEQGTISANTYLQTRIGQITQESDFNIAASQKRAAEMKDNATEQAAEMAKQVAAAQVAIKQLDDLQNNALPQVFQKTSQQFSNALGANASLQSINAGGGANITGQSTQSLQTQQAALLQGQITNMEQLLQYATPYSDTWYQIYENILKATAEAQQLTNEMQNQYAITSQVGGLFGAIGEQSKSLFTGTFGRGFASSFASGAGVLTGAKKTQQEFKADVTTPDKTKTDPLQPVISAANEAGSSLASSSNTGTSALNAFTGALQLSIQALQTFIAGLTGKSAGGDVGSILPNASSLGLDTTSLAGLNLPAYKSPTVTQGDTGASSQGDLWTSLSTSIKGIAGNTPGSFGNLTATLTTATKAIGSFASVIASATSPLGGALGGGQAGAGLGQSLFGSFGPAGAIAGAVGGAALGAIVGQKQQQVQQDIVNIQVAAREMQQAFSAGSASLNSTITTLQGIITTLTAEQSSSKKGSSQFQDLINQYNQQLSQLEAQQTQAIQQLQQQLASVSAPTAYQQWIQNIDSVIQQYSQFAGAAQNATQLAQANEYLTSSLQNIGQQMGDELLQDEESAIQNALQLNQLYNQRNQLELQYLNQVQQIMSQGNLTRQRTQAQSAFSQLYDAQVNYSQQLDSINQQINLAQYQLSVEQQIFNLATTKAGLESQLLTLQEQGVNEDMQRIVALQNLLATMQSTGFSITNLSGLSANDPNALQNTLLQDLVNELNTGQGTQIQLLQSLLNLLSANGGLGVTTAPQVPNASATTSPSPNAVTDVFTALYQSRASFGYGAFKGQNF